ncbi:hypothetical protein EV701_1207 [Chthoniobacter flavus]|uniref:hypothetical protein n=1 Tax=Chthoniobacter flavus TaxID=191863 RepID=UPI001045D049|nr:hypothetical protein [Chthoniobacter flavus]TCO87708.1 hypothetical protein EV701_1207 [Chthoniobacter flavus]
MTKRKFFHGESRFSATTRCLAIAALSTGWLVLFAQAQLAVAAESGAETTSEGDKKKDLPPKPVFDATIEKELTDFMAKVKDGKRKLSNEKMDKIIERVAKTTGLNEQGRKTLETKSREVTDIFLVDWVDAYDRLIRSLMKESQEQILAFIKARSNETAENLALNFRHDLSAAEAQDSKAWAAALKDTLTPEQYATWQKSDTGEREKLHAEIGDRLNAWLDPSREAMNEEVLTKVAQMSRSLNLSKEKADQLKSVGKSAVDESIGKMRDREEKMIAAMDEDARRQMLKNRNIYFSPSQEESPETSKAWKTGLTKLLSADERKQLDTEAAEHLSRRVQALARLMVAEIDARVALTADQRKRLEPICQRIAEKDSKSLSNSLGQGYSQIDVMATLSTEVKPDEAETKAILEPIQRQHWLAVCKIQTEERNAQSRTPTVKPKEEKAALPPEPEDVERAISDYLEGKERLHRQKALAEALLRAEDAGRAANLPAEKIELLKTAARGSAEELLASWKTNADETVRSSIGNTPARFVRSRLENLQEYNFQWRPNSQESDALWTKTFKATLDAGELAAAEKSVNERETFRSESVANFIVAMFDQACPINSEQQAKLTPAVAAAVKEYQADIQSYFSGNNSVSWYLSGFSMFIPVVAVPEADLKSILGAESFEQWTKSRQCGYVMNYWTWIKQNHEARAKAAKQ